VDEFVSAFGPTIVGIVLTALLARGVARLEADAPKKMVKTGLWLPWAAWHLTGGTVAAVAVRSEKMKYLDAGTMIITLLGLPMLTLMASALLQAMVWTRADSVPRRTRAPWRVFEIYRSPWGLLLLATLTGVGAFLGSHLDLQDHDNPTGYGDPASLSAAP
jgi:hypothetical protein